MTNHKSGCGYRYNDDFRKKVCFTLHYSGRNFKDLNSEYGVPKGTIYEWVKKLTPMELESRFLFSKVPLTIQH